MAATTLEGRIAELEAQVREFEDRLNALRQPRTDLFNIPKLEIDPQIPLAQEVSVIAETQDARRTDLVVGFTNPRPDLIDRFELWASNVTGQSKEPYLVASVKDSPAAFSIEADQDTSVSIGIRTITKDGLSSTLGGSPTIGTSIVRDTSSTVADGSIGDAKLDRVTDPITIVSADIANLAVTTAKINTAAITNAKIGALAVDTAQIAAAAVGTAQIANLAVTTALINNLAVTNAKINDLAAAKITAGSLSASVAVLGTVVAAQILAGTMSAVNVSAGTFNLVSGTETMAINGTDGFKQTSTSAVSNVEISGGTLGVAGNTGNLRVGIQSFEISARNSTGSFVFQMASDFTDLGQANSAYVTINNSSGAERVELGVDGGDNGMIVVSSDGSVDSVIIGGDNGLGQADSGYVGVHNSSGAVKAEMGVDSGGMGLIKAQGATTADVQAVVSSNSAVIRGSSTTASNGLYVNGTQVVGPRETDPGASPTTEQLRQVLLGHGLI